jgi:D-alanine-D-alanine ligase
MSKKIKVGVLFGGRSSEHEVSLVSATSVINSLDKDKYDVVMIGITKEGRWLSSENALKMLKEAKKLEYNNEKILLPDPNQKGLIEIQKNKFNFDEKIDVIFPVLHGSFGEDGTIQGLLELANIPYIGAGVLASAVGMDKIIQKNLFSQAHLPITNFLWFYYKNYLKDIEGWIEKIEVKLKYPCFIKPANSGSSIGIYKAHNREELKEYIERASKYDLKILVEKSVENAKEIECAVLGSNEPEASIPGEIIPSNEFYDYDAKYIDGKSECLIPANISPEITSLIRETAIEAFKSIDGYGMARVDFFYSPAENEIFLNEVNTIPGFTKISMYPKLWEASGVSYPKLLDKLIELAIERHSEKSQLENTYKPKSDWYKNGK